MRKHIHLGFCCLLSSMLLLQAETPTMFIRNEAATVDNPARDAKINKIFNSFAQVLSSLVHVAKDPHNKKNILLQVGKMLAEIFNIAGNALPQHELNEEDLQEMRRLLQEVERSAAPLKDYVRENARSMHNYLRAIQLQELDHVLRSDVDMLEESNAPIIHDEQIQELHTNVSNTLHELVQDLFVIIQHPENPQLIGQSIADMLASIMNVASLTLKYEYLTSNDAEEAVALYLESFSNELTKEIKHLMLQTALHLRGGKCGCSGKSNCNTCSNSCSNNCCNSSSSAVCRPCCNPCATCCRSIRGSEASTRKNCCGCSSCTCSTGNCGTCCNACKTSCCLSDENSISRASSQCCSSCGNACNQCSCKSVSTEADAMGSKCPCNKPKPNPNPTTNLCESVFADDMANAEISRGCCSSSCGSCSSCGNACDKCSCRSADAEAAKCPCDPDPTRESVSVDDMSDAAISKGCCSSSCGSCNSCGNACDKCSCRSVDADDMTNAAISKSCCSSSCGSCNSCGNACDKCSCRSVDAEAAKCPCDPDPTRESVSVDDMSDAAISKGCCSSSCGSCNSCGNACDKCSCRSVDADDMTNAAISKGCCSSSCGSCNSCGNACDKCSCRSVDADDMTNAAISKGCCSSSCGSCNSCGNACDKCSCRSAPSDDVADITSNPTDNDDEISKGCCSSSCNSCNNPSNQCSCKSTPVEAERMSQKCPCNKPKPNPNPDATRNVRHTWHNRTLIYPESYVVAEAETLTKQQSYKHR